MFDMLNKDNCKCGKEHKFSSQIVIENKAIQKLPDLLSDVKSAFIFADNNTYIAAAKNVIDILEKAGIKTKKYVFSCENLEPNESSVGLAIMNFDPAVDVVIGVGSGVINDISKIVANVSQKKYVIVATAPSMDGYASATSSMTVEGLKISLNSKCADIIIGDLDILCCAPIKMMASGLGDMIAKYISICEWRISNLINDEYYCEDVAGLVRSSLKKCVDNAKGLLNRDENAVKAVFEGLVICGAAMKFAGVSRPASGIEHYLSHIWDMRGAEFKTPVEFHGIQCAVGSFISFGLYEKLKSIRPDRQKALKYAENFDFSKWSEEMRLFLGKGAEAMIALEEKEGKYNLKKHEKRLDIIIDKWDEILKVIEQELIPISELEELFDMLNLPKTMQEIGIEDEILPMTFKCAKDIRDKYVLPRLCWDLGILDEIVNV